MFILHLNLHESRRHGHLEMLAELFYARLNYPGLWATRKIALSMIRILKNFWDVLSLLIEVIHLVTISILVVHHGWPERIGQFTGP